MSRHFLLFGTHPALSQAEMVAVLGDVPYERIQGMTVVDMASWDGAALQERLAGTVKLGEVIWKGPVRELNSVVLADQIDVRPRADRVLYGLTLIGGSDTNRRALKHLPIELKRELVSRKRSSRWVTGDRGDLSPAAVAKLKLTTDGYDFVIGITGSNAVVGLTTHVQNADAWSERDYGRPFRDAKTGMLPPKLARMMVNLAFPDTRYTLRDQRLLDPFCGGGTVLMEASLMGVGHLIGSDIDATQVTGAKQNMDWMHKRLMIHTEEWERIQLTVASAEVMDRHIKPGSVDAIVTEGFLGKPLRGHESTAFLTAQKKEIETLWRKTLPALGRTLKPHGRLVCTWPVFMTKHETVLVDLTEELPSLGFQYTNTESLTYGRSDQKVHRSVVILRKT